MAGKKFHYAFVTYFDNDCKVKRILCKPRTNNAIIKAQKLANNLYC